ncbi:MAG: hypothetical protein F6J97_08580 [Leptolyngbya sp. SIO4C1]|nr:hypothetical protein [Leptolyngbya sp. SIO4C1]
MVATYSFESALKLAAKVNWQVEDIIGGDQQLNFAQRFLPETLANVSGIHCLNDAEKLKLNQIRGNSYLHLFGLVEEFIVPTVIGHLKTNGLTDITAAQALLHFAEEESKHIRLFRQFAKAFERGFGSRCECIGPAHEIAAAIAQHSPLGVMLIILYIEWMTQYHYLESVRNNSFESLDAQFCSLLRHHWLEEAQHTGLDTLMLEQLAQTLSPTEIETGIEDFFKIVAFLNGGLMAQAQLDIASLERATERTFTEAEKAEIQAIQQPSYQWAFIGSGITHRNFVQVFNTIGPSSQARLAEVSQQYQVISFNEYLP